MTALAPVINLEERRARHLGIAYVVPVDRKDRVSLCTDARSRLASELLTHPARSKAVYADLAARYAVSVRTVEYVLASALPGAGQTTPRGRAHCPVPESALDLLCERRSMKQAWRVLQATGSYTRGYVQFTRQVNAKWGKDVVIAALHGSRKSTTVYLQLHRSGFMYRYTIDLFDLRMEVLDEKGHLVHPTGMLIREDHTGLIVTAYVFESSEVSAAMVANLLAQAMVGYTVVPQDGPTTELGGRPRQVFCDNGAQFASEELRTKLTGLGIEVSHSNSYASNENGAHERQHRTVRDQLLRSLPASNDGRRDRRDELVDSRPPITLDELRELVARWTWWHNTEPAGSDQPSPIQRWRDATELTPAERADPAEIAHLSLIRKTTCQLYRQGVLLNTRYYVTPNLSIAGLKRFAVGIWLGDKNHIEIFDKAGTKHFGRATNNAERTAAEEQAILGHRASVDRRVKNADRRANARDPMDRPDLPPLPDLRLPGSLIDPPSIEVVTIESMLDDLDTDNRPPDHRASIAKSQEGQPDQ